jgi:hypothetical protein
MGGGLLSGLAGGLAGSMIGNAIFGDHGQIEVATPREGIISDEQAWQGTQAPDANSDLDAYYSHHFGLDEGDLDRLGPLRLPERQE